MPHILQKRLFFILPVALLAALFIGCTGADPATPTPTATPRAAATATPEPPPSTEPVTLTVYSGRSEELVGPIIEQFRQLTGVNVEVRWGGTAEIAATIMEEGNNTRADVFYAQDPGALGALRDRFAELPDEILNRAQPQFQADDGKWVGISGRARVMVYNNERLTEDELPDSVWDLTDPKWRGRIGWAPTNGSFQVMVTGMRQLWGEERTKEWLEGIQANDVKVYPKNTPQVAAVGAGEIDVGMVNHYYLFRFLAEEGENFPARNHHPKAGDPGALIMVSGIGVLEQSEHKETAFKLVEFLLSEVGQQYFASQTFEYPVIEGVRTQRVLTPISEIDAPDIELQDLSDLDGTLQLLQESGVL